MAKAETKIEVPPVLEAAKRKLGYLMAVFPEGHDLLKSMLEFRAELEANPSEMIGNYMILHAFVRQAFDDPVYGTQFAAHVRAVKEAKEAAGTSSKDDAAYLAKIRLEESMRAKVKEIE